MKIKELLSLLKAEISANKAIYLVLFGVILMGLFVRVYRIGAILGFYYDQGRDALAIWDLWHKGNFFLVGPTTGIAGILRGPFYYYLIAPFYLLGRGNPVWPAFFLGFLSTLATIVVFLLGVKIKDRVTGLIAAIIAGFSFQVIIASRWLSNPTPMLLLGPLLVLFMLYFAEGKKWGLAATAFVSGLSLFHFGSAGEFFYFPAIFVFLLYLVLRERARSKSFKKALVKVGLTRRVVLFSLGALAISVLPLIIFDIRNNFILANNISKFLVEDKSFKVNFWQVFSQRLDFYYEVFSSKIFHWRRDKEVILLSVVAGYFLIFLPRLIKKDGVKIALILLLSVTLGLLLFQGNFGNIYDYYLTGYYLIFILLFSVVLGILWEKPVTRVFVLFFLFTFLVGNSRFTRYKLIADGPETIVFGNQKQAVGYIFEDAVETPFNVDFYVPPVIPYSYEYLFKWLGREEYGRVPEEALVPLLYTLREVDSQNPQLLEAWLKRQAGIGEVVETAKFGGITVEKRLRK